MAGKSIEILFGVKGGGSVSGASGAQILSDLRSIVAQVEQTGITELKFGIDKTGLQSEANTYRTEIQKIIDSAKTNKQKIKLLSYASEQEELLKYKVAKEQEAAARRKNASNAKEEAASIREANQAYNLESKNRKKYYELSMTMAKYGPQIQKAGLYKEGQDLLSGFDVGHGKNPKGGFKDIRQAEVEMDRFKQKLIDSGVYAQTLSGRLKELFGQHLNTAIAMLGVHALQLSLRKVVQNVVEIDTAMTELRKVTDETNSTYNNFLVRAGDNAERLGSKISDLVYATADFARLGYSLQDAEFLAQVATVYKNVGDGIDNISTASESIISTMKAFNIEAGKAMKIVDVFNEVGNKYAISSVGVGESLKRSAAAMASANNTLEETVALATAANSVVQDPEKVGTSLKTVSMYLRSAKTELEESGESTEGMATSVSKLRAELMALTGGNVDILEADGETYKSTYEILKDISSVFGELTDLTQANILERIGGKRNANIVASILNNFEVAEQSLQTALNSSGSAMKENEKYLDSIEGKMAQANAIFQYISRSVLSSDLLKFLLDTGKGILTVLNGILGAGDGLIIKIGAVVAALALLRNLDLSNKFNSIHTWLVDLITTNGLLTTQILVLNSKGLMGLVTSIPKLVAALLSWKFGADQANVATLGLSGALKALDINPVMILIPLLAAGVAAITSFTDSWESTDERLSSEIEKNKEKIQSYDEEINVLDDLHTKLLEAKGDRHELAAIYDDLNKYISVTPKLLNGEAEAWSAAKIELGAYIKAEKEHRAELAYDNANKYKQKFNNAGVARDTLGIDFLARDLSGSEMRGAAKEYSKAISEFLSSGQAYDKAIEKAQEAINLRALNTSWSGLVGSEEWEIYWNNQVTMAKEAFADVISTYDGPGGANFASSIVDALVRSGLNSEEIQSELSNILTDETLSDAYQNFINSISNGGVGLSGAKQSLDSAIGSITEKYPMLATAFDYITKAVANMENSINEANRTKLANPFVDSIKEISESLSEIENAADLLSNMKKELKDDGRISGASMLDLFEKFSDVDGFENYIKVITNSKASTQELQDALNGLYGAYINNTGILEDVTEENYDYVVAQLEALGVTNAQDVATANMLIKMAQFNQKSSDRVRQILIENGASKTMIETYAALSNSYISAQAAMTKALTPAVETRLKNLGIELEGIETVADAYKAIVDTFDDAHGKGARAYSKEWVKTYGKEFGINEADYLDDDVWAKRFIGEDNYNAMMAYAKAAEKRKELERLIGQLTSGGAITTEVPDPSKDTKTAGDKALDRWKAFYDELKHKREMNLITDKQYYDTLAKNYRSYLGNYEETADEIWSVQEEIYNNLKALYKEDLESQKEALEKKKDDLKTFYDKQKQMLEDQYDEEEEQDKRRDYSKEIGELKTLIGVLQRDSTQEGKRRLEEAKDQLAEKQKEYEKWERDNAKNAALEGIDKQYEKEAATIDEQIAKIDSQIESIDNGVNGIYSIIKSWGQSKGYRTDGLAMGTPSATGGLYRTQEQGSEILGLNLGSGVFTYLTPKSKVWNAAATSNLYEFANSPGQFLSQHLSSMQSNVPSVQTTSVSVGDIVINGSADSSTVAALNKARNNITYTVLEEIKKLRR